MLELQGALEQRDKFIRQLTTRLQETVASKSSDTCDDRPDYMQETQNLSQQVVLLQKQLTQVRIVVLWSSLSPSSDLSLSSIYGCARKVFFFKFCSLLKL